MARNTGNVGNARPSRLGAAHTGGDKVHVNHVRAACWLIAPVASSWRADKARHLGHTPLARSQEGCKAVSQLAKSFSRFTESNISPAASGLIDSSISVDLTATAAGAATVAVAAAAHVDS